MKSIVVVLVLAVSGLAQNQTVTCTPVGNVLSCDNGVSATTVGSSLVITNPAPASALDPAVLYSISHPTAPQLDPLNTYALALAIRQQRRLKPPKQKKLKNSEKMYLQCATHPAGEYAAAPTAECQAWLDKQK